MSGDTKRQIIEVVIDDKAARQALDRILGDLQRAADLASGLDLGGASASTGGSSSDRGTSSTAGGGGGSPGGGSRGRSRGAGSTSGGGAGGDGGGGGGGTSSTSGGGGGGTSSDRAAEAAARKRAQEDVARARREDQQHALRDRQAAARRQQGYAATEAVLHSAGNGTVAAPFSATAGVLGAMGVPVLGAAAALFGVAAHQRYQYAMQLAALERPQEVGRQHGIDLGINSTLVDRGAMYGFSPQESIHMYSNYARSIGQDLGSWGPSGSAAFDPFSAQLKGISPDALAAFQATSGKGGGSTRNLGQMADLTSKVIGTAETQFGMRGSRIDELLQRMTAGITQMAEEGMHLDPAALLSLASSLDNTNSRAFGGMAGMRGALQLSQVGVRASQSFASTFSGLTDAAMMADAFGRTSDPLEALAIMQRAASDPKQVRSIVKAQLGSAAGLAYAGAGFSAEQAKVLAGSLKGATLTDTQDVDPTGQMLSSRKAYSERNLLSKAAADPELSKQMIEFAENINDMLSEIARGSGVVIEKLNELVAVFKR